MILVVLTFTGLDSGVAGGSGYVKDHLGQSWEQSWREKKEGNENCVNIFSMFCTKRVCLGQMSTSG